MAAQLVNLGLVGVPPQGGWGALEALPRQPRLRLTEVFDPCLATADEAARRREISCSPSLDGLLRRVRGVMIGDLKWMGPEPMIRAASLQRPALILAGALASLSGDDLDRLQRFATLTGMLMMPELAHRWARATLRLRELTATRMGAIEHLEVLVPGAADAFAQLMALDWCGNVVQSEFRSASVSSAGDEVRLAFRRLDREGAPVTAWLRETTTAAETFGFPLVEARIACRHGKIRVTGEGSLEWQIERRVEAENLTGDRCASDVMLDLFGRRLVGGIVPTPDLGDVLRAGRAQRAIQESIRTGGAAPVE